MLQCKNKSSNIAHNRISCEFRFLGTFGFQLCAHLVFAFINEHADTIPTSNLLDWIETANKLTLVSPKTQEENTRVYFSPGTQCREAIIQQIRQAKSSLHICVFTISDNEITDEIIDASKRGINIQIISDNDKAYDKGSDVIRMAELGIPTKVDGTRGHMHHKFCVIDKETVISGSYNWTRSAADRNYENITIGTHPRITKTFLSEFHKLWNNLETIHN